MRADRATRWPILRGLLGIAQMIAATCSLWSLAATGASRATYVYCEVTTALAITSLYLFRDRWWWKS